MVAWMEKQKILKSYLHSDILALGERELKKFQAEIEAMMQKKLRDEFAEECHILESEKRFIIRRNADEIHSKYEEYFKGAQQELTEKLQVELMNINAKCNEKLQKAIIKAQMDTTHDVLRKIRPQMNWVVTSLYKELEQTRRAQKEKMIVDFNNIMSFRNIIIYKILNFEKIKSLHELIAKQEETINTMSEKITKYRNKNKMLQEKINALTKEFQKFINFAFNTLPEHADFLLPLDLLSVNSTNKEDSKQEKSDK
ncbi:hypothetical protein G5I_01957 [Acromyrmex echinatior]|uniref:Uncharacterized protein n=1 Tax=Acromyrmex echinatior TaxID=103372 RepID=F4W911_ACREC|nr:hypothetical protein G5I_01957 [Acromyrmex echinatior]